MYIKFPRDRWKEIERAEKNDREGNKIFKELKKEFIEKNKVLYADPNFNWHKLWPEKQYSTEKLSILVEKEKPKYLRTKCLFIPGLVHPYEQGFSKNEKYTPRY